jgi:hypothetical protein
MKKYNEIMAEIIAKGGPVNETLIELLEEAGKYDISGNICKKKQHK